MKIDPDDMISQAEAARIRGVSHQAIVDLVRRGRLTAVKIGGKVFLRRSDVESYEKLRQGRPSTKTTKLRNRTSPSKRQTQKK